MPRREQKRGISTRLAIVNAALGEFASKGFDGASTRVIATQAGVQHPLLTYHFKTKAVLWEAVAEHVGTSIGEMLKANASTEVYSAREYVRAAFRQFYRVMIERPDFHHFMLRESRPGNARLTWIADRFGRPIHDQITAHIELAQNAGDLPRGSPTMIYYFLVGTVTVLSTMAAEIEVVAGIDVGEDMVIENYWKLLESFVFPKPFPC